VGVKQYNETRGVISGYSTTSNIGSQDQIIIQLREKLQQFNAINVEIFNFSSPSSCCSKYHISASMSMAEKVEMQENE
jgi:hypothetical protein